MRKELLKLMFSFKQVTQMFSLLVMLLIILTIILAREHALNISTAQSIKDRLLPWTCSDKRHPLLKFLSSGLVSGINPFTTLVMHPHSMKYISKEISRNSNSSLGTSRTIALLQLPLWIRDPLRWSLTKRWNKTSCHLLRISKRE